MHGVDFVVGEAANVLEVVAHAVEKELVRSGPRNSLRSRKRPSTRMRTTPCAARRSANGSREPVGIMPTPKQPRSVSSLSASATNLAGAMARDGVLHALRLVVIVDGLPDGVGLALHAGVEAAHHALQFGEFLHHLGGEIALGRVRAARTAWASPPSSGANFRARIMRSVFSR
jgi:hypothetical protein